MPTFASTPSRAADSRAHCAPRSTALSTAHVEPVRRRSAAGVLLAAVVAIALAIGGGPTTAAAAGAAASDQSHTESPAAASSSPVLVVGLGDSVPSGGGCRCTSFVVRAGRLVAAEQERTLSVSNHAVSGETTARLLSRLSVASVRQALKYSDLAVVTIGANDLDESQVALGRCWPTSTSACYAAALTRARTNLTKILTTVIHLQRLTRSETVVTGYWNVFKDGKVGRARGAAYVRGSDTLTRAFNAMVKKVARATGAIYADVYTPFKGVGGTRDCTSLLAADGDHPNAAGHRRLAAAVVRSLGAKVDSL